MTVPNILTVFRLSMAPVLVMLAWFGYERGFLIILAAAFISDGIDGPIARLMRTESELGPKLDTWADVTIYLSAPVGAWLLWPDLIRHELLYFILIVASIVVPLSACLLRFRTTTSYHTWMAKTAAFCTTVSSLLLFMQISPVPFRVAAVICVIAGIEETLITLKVDKPGSNVRSLWHVMRKT